MFIKSNSIKKIKTYLKLAVIAIIKTIKEINIGKWRIRISFIRSC
jgi:hypothetical protein